MESNGVCPRQLIRLINPRSIPSSCAFLLVRSKIPRPLPTKSARLTRTYQSPSPSFRHHFVLSSHDHDISRHVAQDRDISRHYHVLCAANAVFFPMPILFLCFSFRLTRLADPALVTSVLTYRVQYQTRGHWGQTPTYLGFPLRIHCDFLNNLTSMCLAGTC